jgi:HK97 gp10 family phage protein
VPNLVTITGINDVGKVLTQIAPQQAKNLLRSTTYAMAQEITKDAKASAPQDHGDLHVAMKTRRAKARVGIEAAGAEAIVGRRAFYWRFLEYGQGPDGVEHAFYMRAIKAMESKMADMFLRIFVSKLIKTIARREKAMSK